MTNIQKSLRTMLVWLSGNRKLNTNDSTVQCKVSSNDMLRSKKKRQQAIFTE